MIERKKTIHLICNAHIDPVWLWEWQAGAAETLSTFLIAAELCEQDKAFIFNHNEAILYKWVQEYESDLFRRIQKLVKKGKWHIMGGWYLQPDCNMPSGESFVRQILIGKNYFKKYFGVEPTTAINFDPFGHTRGLVQILAKAGYDSYLFMRPEKEFLSLSSDEFVWVGYDGSEVMAKRFPCGYNSMPGLARQKIEQWIKDYPDMKARMIPWGMGNHGGGPSRRDLRDVNRLIERNKDYHIMHSTPEIYFQELRRMRDALPRHAKDLNPFSVGCYTSQIRIKQKHRLLENEIYSAEKMSAAAAVQGLMEYPRDQIDQATCDLLTAQFHDALPGTSIQPVEEATLQILDHGLEIAARVKARAFFVLAAGQPKARNKQIPILIYNHHPFKLKQMIECEFHLPTPISDGSFNQVLIYRQGRLITSQVEQELSSMVSDWGKKVVFLAELAPGQMNRFDCRLELLPKKPPIKLKPRNNKIAVKTNDIEVIVNTRTGLIDRYRVNGIDCLEKNAFQPLVIKDNPDSWGMMVKSFRNVAGRFKLMSKKAGAIYSGLESPAIDSVRVIEDGPVRSVVEALFAYGNSFICQRYKIPKVGAEIELETRVQWNEKDRMLKLAVPTITEDGVYLGQTAYGVAELPSNGNEAVAQKWVAVVSRKKNLALTCVNDGTYGSDYSTNGLRLTLLRSAGYSCHPHDRSVSTPPGRFSPRTEQGERMFRFWFNAGKIAERIKHIDREALVRNEKPYALSFFPSGSGKKTKPFAILSDDVIQIAAIKQAENNNDFIIRLFEPTGRKRKTVLSMPAIGKNIQLTLAGFEIKTIRINPKTGKFVLTNLMEKKKTQNLI